MTTISAEIFPRVPASGETVAPKSPITVRSYSWHVRGGPDTAQLEMTGDPMQTWDVLDWLRCPVMLHDGNGTPVWWGYVETVDVGVGAVTIGATIDSLANRVAVAYTENTGAGSQRDTTPWAGDLASISLFGTKELLLSQSDLNGDSAIAYRNAQLAIRKTPRSVLNPRHGTKLTARIVCRGWYATLAWKYFSRSQGRYAYVPTAGTSATTFPFGIPAVSDPDPLKAKPAYLKLAQQFWITYGNWSVATIKMQIRRVGTPTEGVRLSLWTNHVTNGVPQTEVTAATVPDSAIGGAGGDWITFTLPIPWSVDPLNVYWIVLEKNGGAPHKDNYYTVQGASSIVVPPGYPIFWDGTTWPVLNGTLIFIMEGSEETHLQMAAMIDASDQFISGYNVTDENMLTTVGSGVFSNPYRNGDTNALVELTRLLDVGNSAGLRYLATVSPGGFVTVYPEPLENRYKNWSLQPDGTLLDELGTIIPASSCPVGHWVSIEGLLPKHTGIQVLSIPPAFFIESSSYNALTGSWDPSPRGAAALGDIGRIRQG